MNDASIAANTQKYLISILIIIHVPRLSLMSLITRHNFINTQDLARIMPPNIFSNL